MSKWDDYRRTEVQAAIREGKLAKIGDVKCEKCGEPAEHKHHEDYGKPLEVWYLCVKCHKQRHKELGWGVGGRPRSFRPSFLDYNLTKLPLGSFTIFKDMSVSKASVTANYFKRFGMKFKCFTYDTGAVIFRIE